MIILSVMISFVHTVNRSLTCSFWLQGRDGQTSVQPSRPFPVLSDDTSLVAVSSLPESVSMATTSLQIINWCSDF